MQRIYTALLLVLLTVLGYSEKSYAQDITIYVADVTASNATVTVTPSGDDIKFFCGAYTASEYDEYAALDGGIIGKQIANWKRLADIYMEPWTTTMSYTLLSGEYISSLSALYGGSITQETEYVVFAFGMTAEGEVSAPLTSVKLTTPAAKKSDNTFVINVKHVWVSSAPEAAVRLSAEVSVTPSNADRYTVACLESKYLTNYDFNDSTSLALLAREQVVPYANNFFTASCDTTFSAMRKDKDFYVIVVGMEDGVATTLPTLTLFRTEVPNPLFSLEVSDITCADAHIKVQPLNLEQKYQWGVIRKSIVEEKCEGDIQKIYNRDIEWWLFLSNMYPGTTWEEFSLQFHSTGALEGSYRDLIGSESEPGTPLDWGTEHYLYAYAIDDEGHKSSDIYTVPFSTLPRTIIDTNFDISLVRIEPDPNAATVKAIIRVTPENPTMEYAICCFDAKYYDFYVNNEKYTMEDYWMNQVYTSLQGPFVGEREFGYSNLKPNKAYVFNVMGIDEIPVTDCFVLRFLTTDSGGFADLDDNVFTVISVNNGIEISGSYSTASIYAVDGRHMAILNGQTHLSLPTGVYIVKAYTLDGESIIKVAVK